MILKRIAEGIRMKKLLTMIALVVVSATATANDDPPLRTIQDFFVAMTDGDNDGMRATATEDFHILEDGELWTMDILISLVEELVPTWQRRNFYGHIRTHIDGDRAWVSYWNKATFKINGQDMERQWLESAVMKKIKGRWVIEMIHSTRLGPEKSIPEDVVLVEHVPEAGE